MSDETRLEAGETPVAMTDGDGEAAATRVRLDPAQLRAIVEALVFASPEPLSLKALCRVLADEPKEDVVAALEAVRETYSERPGLHVVEVAGGFQITTRPELHDWVRRLFHERSTQKLSVAALETLSVVAYKQPITQAEIAEIRGVNVSGVLSTLLERHLLKIVGRKNVIGRPFLYGTTREFLLRFGLKDVSDLPRVEDMAQQLGFDAPPMLTERMVPEEMLPLDDDDLASLGDATADAPAETPADEADSRPLRPVPAAGRRRPVVCGPVGDGRARSPVRPGPAGRAEVADPAGRVADGRPPAEGRDAA